MNESNNQSFDVMASESEIFLLYVRMNRLQATAQLCASPVSRWPLLTHYPGRVVLAHTHTQPPRHLNDVNYEKINTAAPFSVSYTHVRT